MSKSAPSSQTKFDGPQRRVSRRIIALVCLALSLTIALGVMAQQRMLPGMSKLAVASPDNFVAKVIPLVNAGSAGAATMPLAPTGEDHSLSLNGTNTYMEVPNTNNLSVGTAFTAEAWVNYTARATSPDYHSILSYGDWGGQYVFYYTLRIADGKIRFDLGQGSGSYSALVGSTTVSPGVWHHIAAVYKDSQMRIYVDGKLDGSQSFTWAPPTIGTIFRIGSETLNPFYFKGMIDEVRISTGAVYTQDFTPQAKLAKIDGATVGLWKFDDQTAKNTPDNNNNGILYGGFSYPTDVPSLNSLSLSGTDSYMHVPTNSILNLRDSFTAEAWVNYTVKGASPDYHSILSCGDWASQYVFYYTLRIADGKVRFDLGQASGSYTALIGSTTLTAGSWHHVAAVYASGQMRIYVDGVLDGSQSYTWTPPSMATIFRIGRETLNPFNFKGLIDEVRISTGAIYTSTFTPQTYLTRTEGVTKGLWKFDGKTPRDYLRTINGGNDGTLYGTDYSSEVPSGGSGGGGTPTAPNPPTGLDATAFSSSQINLTWSDNSSNEDGFKIERKTGGSGTYAQIAEVGENATSYSNTGLTSGTQYYYRVRATNEVGDSAYSTGAQATTGNNAPTVSIAAPSTGQTFAAPATITISADATDSDGTISKVEYFQNGNYVGESSPPSSHSFSWTNVAAGNYILTAKATDNNGAVTTSAQISITVTAPTTSSPFVEARLDPNNRTGQPGEDLLSRNFNWSLPLVGLPGRAGLDLGISLTYNSLVWTRDTAINTIKYDVDNGSPSPGFRLGFPVIEQKHYNAKTGKNGFLMVTPSGSRVELRQVGTSNVYEAADSSYLQLTDNDSNLLVRTTDGTQLTYLPYGLQYQCAKIQDRNGNFISITRNTDGRIISVVDTLGRVITFKYYDNSTNLEYISQEWKVNNQTQTHKWARFEYGPQTIETGFSSELTVIGPQNNTQISVLKKVTLADNSYFTFSYTGWGQVSRITHFAADNHQLSYVNYTFETSTTDSPRITERKDWAEKWNYNQSGVEQEALTTFSAPAIASWEMPNETTPHEGVVGQVTMPDNTRTKVYYPSSGWKAGLPERTETVTMSNNQVQRWTTTHWTQDNENFTSQLNPRVKETNIGDPAGNRRQTIISYQSFLQTTGSSWHLPVDVSKGDGTSILRHVQTDYLMDDIDPAKLEADYTSRGIIGLVRETRLYEGAGTGNLESKVSYTYDEAEYLTNQAGLIQHDNDNYGVSFRFRGNLTSVQRWDVNSPTLAAESVVSNIGYNTAGSVLSMRDPLGHTVTISYAESFSDGNNSRNTFAYPTSVTDPGGFFTESKYNYDTGAVTRIKNPKGAEVVMQYDSIGRLDRRILHDSILIQDGSYTRFEYPTSQTHVKSYTLLETGVEAFSLQVTDGAGRIIGTAAKHPGSSGGYSAQKMRYDVMGRATGQTNPAEIGNPENVAVANWTTVGDDASTGWIWITQEYDWKGRVTRSINGADNTTSEALYGGCGCAGGEVVVTRDEVGRRRKVIYDAVGRPWKTQVLFEQAKSETLNDTGQVYAATVNSYNARDQITSVKQYSGAETSDGSCPTGATCQQTVMTYDGHGRLKTRKSPSQDVATSYDYYTDDTVQKVTDGRGAYATFLYNSRHLVTNIAYGTPAGSNIAVTPAVEYNYDSAGNRQWMTDGLGRVDYVYNTFSRLKSEARNINDPLTALNQTFTLTYDYTLGGQLKSITDPSGSQINYNYDQAGRVQSVTSGTSFGGVTQYADNAQYRAWGALKHLEYGNNPRELDITYNSRLQATNFYIAGTSSNVISKNYQYNPDGRLRYSEDTTDTTSHRFDRSYTYDRVGRVTRALSGPAAREEPDTTERPYKQYYNYDAFGHLTRRSGQVWNALNNGSGTTFYPSEATYVNDKRTGWTYDAAGNLLSGEGIQYGYDAAGRAITAISGTESNQTQVFDGDGQRVKIVTAITGDDGSGNITTETTIRYEIRSSVLGGAVVTEVNESGVKTRGFVYAGGSVLAVQKKAGTVEFVQWQHTDASGASFRVTGSNGGIHNQESAELDPLGRNAGASAPPQFPPRRTGEDMTYPGFAEATSTRCSIDGIPAPCSLVSNEATVQCPQNDCGPRRMEIYDSHGKHIGSMLSQPFHAYADGFSGFIPQGAHYDGSGQWYIPDASGRRVRPESGDFGLAHTQERQDRNIEREQRRPTKRGQRDPSKLVNEDLEIAEQAILDALDALGSNPDCQDFLKEAGILGSNDDPSDTLRAIRERGGFRRGTSEGNIAFTALAAGRRSIIYLYDSFFTRTVGGTTTQFSPDAPLSTEQARALVILHELAHAVWRNLHGWNPFGMTSAQLDRKLYDLCFNGGQSPLPPGITE